MTQDKVNLAAPGASDGQGSMPSQAARDANPPQRVDHTWFSQAALDVTAERRRQISAEGWTPEHDDQHASGELAVAAACYAMCSDPRDEASILWPWDHEWWKPRDARRNLVRAAALLIAEIERLDRATGN